MRRSTIARFLVVAAVLAMSGVGLRAQARPNFSGSWVYVEEKSKMAEGFSITLAFPSELGIKQTAAEIQMTGTSNHLKPVISTYTLDGSESTFDTAAGKVKARTKWDGNKLVVTATRTYGTPMGDIAVHTTDTYTLAGDVLTVEREQDTNGELKAKGTTIYSRVKAQS